MPGFFRMRLLRTLRGWLPQYRENLSLAVPVMLSQVGQVVVQLFDNAMVGRLGALPLAAVSFGGAVFVIFLFWGTGLSMGLTPLVGEMYARRDYRSSARLLQNALTLYGGVGIVLFAILWVLGDFLGSMGQSPEVAELARPYYGYLAWSVVPFMLFAAFKQFLEGIGNTITGMVVVLTANGVNILFNYLLIYGHWGFPEMGAAGAGLATLISRICMPLFTLGYFLSVPSLRRYFLFFAWIAQGWRTTRRLFAVGLPISMQMVLEVSAFALTLIMMGWIGTVPLAAHQVVLSLSNIVYMVVVGISAATTIMVSHRYGAGDYRGMRRAALASWHLGIVANLLTMACFVAFRRFLPELFTSDRAVIGVAAQLFLMAALYQIPDGLQTIALGVLRGMQDVRITMYYAFVSYIVINLPVGYFCAFILGWGAPGLWVGFIVGLCTAAFLLIRRYRRLYRRLTLD